MELFGIGILEILLIFALFAIIFGPHRLPEIAAQFGRAVRVLRAYAATSATNTSPTLKR